MFWHVLANYDVLLKGNAGDLTVGNAGHFKCRCQPPSVAASVDCWGSSHHRTIGTAGRSLMVHHVIVVFNVHGSTTIVNKSSTTRMVNESATTWMVHKSSSTWMVNECSPTGVHDVHTASGPTSSSSSSSSPGSSTTQMLLWAAPGLRETLCQCPLMTSWTLQSQRWTSGATGLQMNGNMATYIYIKVYLEDLGIIV